MRILFSCLMRRNALPENELLDFAARGPREVVHDVQLLWPLLPGQARPAEVVPQLGQPGDGRPGLQPDNGRGVLAECTRNTVPGEAASPRASMAPNVSGAHQPSFSYRWTRSAGILRMRTSRTFEPHCRVAPWRRYESAPLCDNCILSN